MMFSNDCFISYQEKPDSLKELSIRQIIEQPVNLSRYPLPPEVGHCVVSTYREVAIINHFDAQSVEQFFSHFKHKFVSLKKINFSGLPIRMKFLLEFLREFQDQLEEVDITFCWQLYLSNVEAFNEILKNTKHLHTLNTGEIFQNTIEADDPPNGKLLDDQLKLKKLTVHRLLVLFGEEFQINRKLAEILPPSLSSSLRYLDLSGSTIGRGSALMQLENLETLILYDCYIDSYSDVVTSISNLKKLTYLDVSKRVPEPDEIQLFEVDSNALNLIVNKLPQLTGLDISGTDLVDHKDRNMSAFTCRADRPFEFLGAFHTGSDVAFRTCIPAIVIAGEANETQILNACEAYTNRPDQLVKALDDLFSLYKTIIPRETFGTTDRALDIILNILTKHIMYEQVIVAATAALWCIVKANASTNLNDAKVRKTITRKLLDAMLLHDSNRTILINGGLSLLFLPDIICEHSRVAKISLKMCKDSDQRTQGFGTTLLNTLACQVGGDQKVFIGNLNAIEIMLDIIKKKTSENNCDEILETAWSTLWNITDETPINCKRFLINDGMEIYRNCLTMFDSKEVTRNIMGLLGNVAECESLREHLMVDPHIIRFYQLLHSRIDGIECSYNACGILAHIMSEGQEKWEQYLGRGEDDDLLWITRSKALRAMRGSISRWPINSKRNINYRSFEPILRLLNKNIEPEAQYWAVFALANLTRINPVKYCPMLLPFNGLQKLRDIANDEHTVDYLKNLAEVTIYQYERFEAEGTLAGLELCDSIDMDVIRNFRAETNSSDMGEIIL